MKENINFGQSFDLNIEKILENWETFHAIREIIANAIDEKILTNTKDIEINKLDVDTWIIKDYGRGIEYKHLTQKENNEKLTNPNLIGKFGIGLKDALATFDRKNIKILIKSKHGNIEVKTQKKHGFDDIKTLHAVINSPTEKELIGTEFILSGITLEDMNLAKKQFIVFSNAKILEKTLYGEIVEKQEDKAFIYLNGIKVAEEENFLFSYNITSLDSKIKKSLNRERTNVGRNAYSERVKKILKSTVKEDIIKAIGHDLINISQGTHHDELSWIDIQEHAIKNLNATGKFVFFTPEEASIYPDIVDEVMSQGKEIIYITSSLKQKIRNLIDISGNKILEFDTFIDEYNNSFEYKIIDYSQLSSKEKEIFDQTNEIINLIGGLPRIVKQVVISETIQKNLLSSREEIGHWDSVNRRIIVKRNQLKNLSSYAGTLIHEVIHAKTGAFDCTREFESELTYVIGKLTERQLKSKDNSKKSWFFWK
ncbi:sensor histidine kinase [symbiont of Argiope bruennichi]|uniref:ATP-binding protein n=1 Tax=symbiont of Argiope bruennichi TaxID=2810479 RepID=UPI003DA31FA4